MLAIANMLQAEQRCTVHSNIPTAPPDVASNRTARVDILQKSKSVESWQRHADVFYSEREKKLVFIYIASGFLLAFVTLICCAVIWQQRNRKV